MNKTKLLHEAEQASARCRDTLDSVINDIPKPVQLGLLEQLHALEEPGDAKQFLESIPVGLQWLICWMAQDRLSQFMVQDVGKQIQ